MKTKDLFPSKYLKAATDLLEDGQPMDVDVTITAFEQEEFEGETKNVLYFAQTEKSLILNKTNFGTLLEIHSVDDTDGWIGKSITLYATEVTYGGKTVWGTRIRLTAPKIEKDNPFPDF